eukprot:gene30257-3874_t
MVARELSGTVAMHAPPFVGAADGDALLCAAPGRAKEQCVYGRHAVMDGDAVAELEVRERGRAVVAQARCDSPPPAR